MMKRCLISVVSIVAALALSLSASALDFTNPNVGKGAYPGTANRGAISVECGTMSVLNTIKMSYATEMAIARHCFDALVKVDADGVVVPAAAESWESTDDGLTWTFHLRKGAKWVDYTGAVAGEVTARDFELAIRELLDPSNASEYWTFGAIFKNAAAYYDFKSGVDGAKEVSWDEVGVKAVDDLTLVLELERYLPYFLECVKFEVMSPICSELYERVGPDDYATAPDKMLYNGAFYMTEWSEENRVTVAKDLHWHDAENVELEEINFVKYTNSNTKMNAFQGGEIDIIDLTGEQNMMLTSEGYETLGFSGGYSFYYTCNTLPGPDARWPRAKISDMRSVHLRRAISAALDRQILIDTVMKSSDTPSSCFSFGIKGVRKPSFSDAVRAANGGAPLYSPRADIDSAKKHLEAALVDLGKTSPSDIDITIMTSEGTMSEMFSQAVQEALRKSLGIEPKVEVLTITESRARRNSLNYDMFLMGWGPDFNDPISDLGILTSGDGNNSTGWSCAEYDQLIKLASEERDPDIREGMFIEAERMIADQLPIIPIYWRSERYAMSEKIASGAQRAPFLYYYLTYTKLADR